MFITKEDMYSAINEYQLNNITTDEKIISQAAQTAIGEAASYLNAKYDCDEIFSKEGIERDATVLEQCKSIAIWYLLRLSNADILYDKAKDYYNAAIDWLKRVAGINGKTIAPNLPLKKTDEGIVITKIRFGSNRKFSHNFDD